VATLDLTTAELMRSLAKVAPDDERAQIAAWLERCDIVKYGGMHASAGDAHAVLDGARTLVMTTTRAPGRQATKTEAA
jgi:mannose-6-phosphate isomerase class I